MPICPNCRRPMKKKSSMNFTYALEKAIDDAIRAATYRKPKPELWCCTTMLENPEHAKWKEEMKKYQKKVIKVKKPPVEPLKKIPCADHWALKADPKGMKMSSKFRKEYFIEDEVTHTVYSAR